MPSIVYSLLPTRTNGVRQVLCRPSISMRTVTPRYRLRRRSVAIAIAGHLRYPCVPQLLPLFDHVRIEADGRVVDEEAIVHLPDVHSRDVSRRDDRNRLMKIDRNLQVLGEVIEGAEREHAESRRRSEDAGRDAADGAVAAAGDDDGGAGAGGPSGVRRVLTGAQLDDLGVTPGGAKEIVQLGRELRTFLGWCQRKR
jgi:hypothetical protein